MKRALSAPVPWMQSLKTRLLVLLTIALLPLGVTAVVQTMAVIRDADRLAARDILARTASAANEQEAVLRHAYGAAYGLGAMAAEIGSSDPACGRTMQRFIENRDMFVFAAFVDADGMMRCASTPDDIDFSEDAVWQELVANLQPIATVNRQSVSGGGSVLVVFVPILDKITGELIGGQALSIPHGLTSTLLNEGLERVQLALVSPNGAILAASTGIDNIEPFERLGLRPSDLDIPSEGLLLRPVVDGQSQQPVVLVPLIRDRIYVLGLWSGEDSPLALTLLGTTAPVFPVLMWLTSLIVAFLTVNRLVLTPLGKLGRQMAGFRFDEPDRNFTMIGDAPHEIRRIADTYDRMVDRVVSDHIEMKQTVAEKELLLREVHHRVKNNLQLMSSILNMQIREVQSGEARRILGRLQDRVMGLSAIHKALYSGPRYDTVRADQLLETVISQVLNIGLDKASAVQTEIALQPVTLDADEAVPLSLLVTEAVTNAIKYLGRPATGGPPLIRVHLHQDAQEQVHLTIENTRGVRLWEHQDVGGPGLGARMIQAFASQLGSEAEILETDDLYRLSVTFEKMVMVQDSA